MIEIAEASQILNRSERALRDEVRKALDTGDNTKGEIHGRDCYVAIDESLIPTVVATQNIADDTQMVKDAKEGLVLKKIELETVEAEQKISEAMYQKMLADDGVKEMGIWKDEQKKQLRRNYLLGLELQERIDCQIKSVPYKPLNIPFDGKEALEQYKERINAIVHPETTIVGVKP